MLTVSVCIAVLLLLAFLVWSAADISSNVYIHAFCSIKTSQKVVALTFDDGPDAQVTPRVLDVLSRHSAPATFFVIGNKAKLLPDLIKQIITFNHTLGNHTYSHNDNFSILLPSEMAKEIAAADEAIEEITGKKIEYFRPPLGVTNPMLSIALRRFSHKVIGWNVRPFDTSTHDAALVSRRVIAKLKPGSIILMHDRMPQTPEALETILAYLDANGYRVVSLRELEAMRELSKD